MTPGLIIAEANYQAILKGLLRSIDLTNEQYANLVMYKQMLRNKENGLMIISWKKEIES